MISPRNSIGAAKIKIKQGQPEEGMRLYLDTLTALGPLPLMTFAVFTRGRNSIVRDMERYSSSYKDQPGITALLGQVDTRLAELKEMAAEAAAKHPKPDPIFLAPVEETTGDIIGFPPYDISNVMDIQKLESYAGSLDDDGLCSWFRNGAQQYYAAADRNNHRMLSPLRLYPNGREAAQLGAIFLMAARMEMQWPGRLFHSVAGHINAEGAQSAMAVLVRDIVMETRACGDDVANMVRRAGIAHLADPVI